MGLIKAGLGALSGTMADQWKEFFYCESIDNDVLAVKGQKRTSKRSSNNKDLGSAIKNTFQTIGKRFTYGGDTGKDQRVYYFNTKELVDNKFGTPNPIPFRVVDQNIGLDIDVSVRCSGVYSFRIADPLLFYANVCGNFEQQYDKEQISGQLKTEFISALQPAFANISQQGIRPSALPAHAMELCDAMNQALTQKWSQIRGLVIVSVAMNPITLPEEDAQMIKEAQRMAMLRNPAMAAATLVGAQADAMKTAAGNSAGAMTGFMGMNMANTAGGLNVQNLYAMGQQPASQPQMQQAPAQPAAASSAGQWKCSCGAMVSGNFCPNCGSKKPEDTSWTCSCGAVNTGRFCSNCGSPKPAIKAHYRCDKCGWEPEDSTNPPKFCPNCGDPFNSNDMI